MYEAVFKTVKKSSGIELRESYYLADFLLRMLCFDPTRRDPDGRLKNHFWLLSKYHDDDDHDEAPDAQAALYPKDFAPAPTRQHAKGAYCDSTEHLRRGAQHLLVRDEDFYSEFDPREAGVDAGELDGFRASPELTAKIERKQRSRRQGKVLRNRPRKADKFFHQFYREMSDWKFKCTVASNAR